MLAGVALLMGCHRASESAPPELPPVTVHLQAVTRQPVQSTEDVVGTVRPKLSAAIEAKISGRIVQMLVVPGQLVTNGELLVQLDAHEIQARYDQARAVRQQAESDLKRAADLMQQQILSAAEFDAAQSKFRVADAAANEAETLLGYTRITAAFDGVITRKLADVGDLAMPGKTLLQMENPQALRLEADVPEALLGNLKLGDKLTVSIASVAGEIAGTVAEMSPAADPNSRTFLVKLDLPNAAGLRSGQFGRVVVPVGETEAIRIPAAAVVQRGQMEMVFIAANDRAQMRLVKTGRHLGDDVEIVSGLDAGEKFVLDAPANLVDGQPLNLQP
ncbi:MAG TPA: efflux RND transporter periplasmic adaptor subunit [Verrucomicrobiae bacterium]